MRANRRARHSLRVQTGLRLAIDLFFDVKIRLVSGDFLGRNANFRGIGCVKEVVHMIMVFKVSTVVKPTQPDLIDYD